MLMDRNVLDQICSNKTWSHSWHLQNQGSNVIEGRSQVIDYLQHRLTVIPTFACLVVSTGVVVFSRLKAAAMYIRVR